MVISGAGGPNRGNYYALASTNVALPLSNWERLTTNQFDASGNFNFTNLLNPNAPQVVFSAAVALEPSRSTARESLTSYPSPRKTTAVQLQ